jgi:predicted RNA-binding protein with TRAM domain
VTASAGTGSAVVNWTAGASNGATITSYTVTPYIGTSAQAPVTVSGAPAPTTATVTGLVNGSTYTFTVTATNAAGTSAASAPSNAVTPTGPPSAPGAVTATAGTGSVSLSWSAPNNGGSTITSYTVTPFAGGVAQAPLAVSGNPAPTTATVASLSNGTTYTFTVSATNAFGTSSATTSNPATPLASVSCPCTLFGAVTPTTPDSGDASSVNLGMEFTADRAGFVSGVRFYKAATNGGTHVGSLWTATGTLLASATFTGETASGWQQVTFANPVSVTVGTTYVVSYLAPVGHYAAAAQGFASMVSAPPLYGLASGSLTPNGLYSYASGNAFPTSTFGASNYYVDAIFTTSSATLPSAPTGVVAVAQNAAVSLSWSAPAVGSSSVTSYTVTPFRGTTALAPVTVSGTPPATTAQIAGLTNGTTYTFTVTASSPSGAGPPSTASNPATPQASVSCPCTVLGSTSPAIADAGDAASVNLGMVFTSDTNGFASGVRFYKSAANTGTHVGTLWSSSGTLLASVTFTNETATGWQQANFATPVAIAAGTSYIISYLAPAGHYAAAAGGFNAMVTAPPLYALANGTGTANGVYAYGPTTTFPTSAGNGTNYFVDVVFTSSASPVPGQPTGVVATAGSASVSVSWSAPSSGTGAITSYTVTPFVGSAAQPPVTVGGTPPPTSVQVSGLSNGTTYTFTVSATSSGGTGPASVASNPATPLASLSCACTLFGASAPAVLDSGETTSLNLGVQFTADRNGFITGIRFYKGGTANGGSHVGSLWTATGTLLASATFANESASGWQQVTFASPVAITAGSTYVASYLAPLGHYSDTLSAFTSVAGSPPLYALANSAGTPNGVYLYSSTNAFPSVSGNGANYFVDVVFMTTAGTPPSAPTGVTAAPGGASANVSWTAPSSGDSPITSYTVTPFVGTTAQAPVTVSGSPPPTTATVTGLTNGTTYTFTVSATSAVGTGPASAPSNAVTPSAALVPSAPTGVVAIAGAASASVSWSAPATGGSSVSSYTVTPFVGSVAQTPVTITGTPPPTTANVTGLANGTTYTFKVTATSSGGTGPASVASNPATPLAAVSCMCTLFGSQTPATIDSGDAGSVNLGVQFTADRNGYIAGVRFYKAATNGGTHVGSLWSSAGALLASATFTNESASGWQQVAFASPVAVTAGTTYVASYLAPAGHYSDSAGALSSMVSSPPLYALANAAGTPNGVYAYASSNTFPSNSYNATNYFVDVVFTLNAGTLPGAPTAVSATAGNAAATLSWTAPAAGSSPIASYTVTPYIGAVAQAPLTISGSPPATTANVTGLVNGTTYTFTVSATSAVGTGQPSSPSNPATPTASATCPCTVLGSQTPPVIDSGDTGRVNLGMQFVPDRNGTVTGVRFYKAATNTGVHIGSLWSSTGTLLASATFTNETASGWQQVNFGSPVAVTAGTTYVVSYLAPNGHYSVGGQGFASAISSPPLYAPASSASTPNGLYAYGSGNAFPSSTYNASNYYVDVTFQ